MMSSASGKSSEIKIVLKYRGYVKRKAVNQISYSFVETLSTKLMVFKLCAPENAIATCDI